MLSKDLDISLVLTRNEIIPQEANFQPQSFTKSKKSIQEKEDLLANICQTNEGEKRGIMTKQ